MEFCLASTRLSEIANRYSLKLWGPDREIVAMGTLDSRSAHRDRLLTYASTPHWAERFAISGLAGCIVPQELEFLLPSGGSALLVEGDASATFYEVFTDSVQEGRWDTLPDSVGPNTVIAPSAVVHPGVIIGADCTIMDNVVLLPNTRLGDRVTIKPNATLGGDGFQVATVRGGRRVIPHAGGVDVGDDAFIGSQTCIDSGLFGESTWVGPGAMIDNLVHVAHSARVGPGATVIACSEISGSVIVGAGAWLGPNTAVNPQIVIGDCAYIGTGSTVVRDVPAHALAYGSPARATAWVCRCHAKLPDHAENGFAVCPECGRSFSFSDGFATEVVVQ